MEYFVLSNINHDGKAFSRGETIELSDEFAKPLMEAGAIQTEPLGEQPATPVAPAPEQKDEVTVGGTKQQTGEPSIDAPATASEVHGEAEDVSPVVEEAPVAGRRTRGGRAQPVDPSANL